MAILWQVLHERKAERDRKRAAQPTQPIAYTGTGTSGATAAVPVAQTEKQKRATEMAMFTGWDNDPAIRALQEKSAAIYIDTGRWDTPEQKALNEQAQKMRQYNNPMYDPTKTPYGPRDWMDAEKITPRDTTPNANSIEGAIDGALNAGKFGSYLQAGVGVVFLMIVTSMFRRR